MPSRAPSQSQSPPLPPQLSPTIPQPASPSRPPVRRNLFSAHLSRRPASSQPSQPSNSQPSQSFSQTPLLPPQPQRTVSSPFASPPQLHPSFTSQYDPTISPTHPLSPKTRETVFAGGIIARDATTGRPLLPSIPTLPRQLRLDDDDEGEDDEEEEDRNSDDEAQHARAPSVHPFNTASHDPFSSPSHAQHPSQTQPQDTTTYVNPADTEQEEEEVLEKQRYDSQLEDMMSRYRSREFAKQHPKGKGGKVEDGKEREDDEKQELMAHLMGALRREVSRMEEEGWMFGDAERLVEEGEGMVMGGGQGVGMVGGGGGGGFE